MLEKFQVGYGGVFRTSADSQQEDFKVPDKFVVDLCSSKASSRFLHPPLMPRKAFLTFSDVTLLSRSCKSRYTLYIADLALSTSALISVAPSLCLHIQGGTIWGTNFVRFSLFCVLTP
jgi:hypothetical protein